MRMSRKKKKIVVPTEEEVAQYAGDRAKDGEAVEPPADSEAQLTSEETGPQTAGESGEERRSESDEWKDKFLRAKAELANFQRRSTKDRQAALKYATADLVKALLPVLDDLQRVVDSGATATGAESVADGVKLTIENFLKVLEQHHATRIEAAGEPFDPAVHEAMMEQPSADHAARTVLQVVAEGYRLYDRVLRPAKVVVSKAGEPQAAEQAESAEKVE
jgi:molecular chaperone GrpE